MARFDLIIPMKPLAQAKLRLRDVLDPAGRGALMSQMLADGLTAAQSARRVGRVFVVTQDETAARLAQDSGAAVLGDDGSGLNEAVRLAVETRVRAGAEAIAVVHADLPWLTAAALDRFLGLVPSPNGAAIASDHRGQGTSALAWRGRPGFTQFAFGVGSFQRHVSLAREAGLDLRLLEADLAFHDVDDADDLRALGSASPNYRRLIAEECLNE